MPQDEQATILLVEDNPLTLHLLVEHLNRSGLQTTIARSGEEAMKQAGMHKPDLILMDVMLPGMDGFETCRRLKGNNLFKDIPIIFMTALSDTQEKVRAYEAGCVDYITKPVDVKEVAARVTTRLTIQKLQRRLRMRDNIISSGSQSMPQGQKPAIVVVEDNPMTLQLVLKYLEGMGFDAKGFPTGEEGLDYVKTAIPDLILLDVMLPGIDGFETCRQLKSSAITRDIPVIFMTALSDTADKVKAFEVGAADYITKPHHYAEMAARINTHLSLKTLQRQLKRTKT